MKQFKKVLTVILVFAVLIVGAVAVSSCSVVQDFIEKIPGLEDFIGKNPDVPDEPDEPDVPDEPVHTHSLSEVAEVPATCTEAGTKAYYVCADCDKMFADAEGKTEIQSPETIAASGHTEKTLEKVDPTCTKTGLTEGKYCEVCEEVLVKQETITALGHTEKTLEKVDPTCTKTGLTEGKYCEVCEEVLVKQETITALGHTEKTLEKVDPTCTKTGLTEGKYCEVCEEVLVKQETITALGHTEKTLEKVDPTCTKTGLTEGKYCEVCKEVLVKQETITALGHTEKTLEKVDPTCTKTGLTEGKYCEVCEEVLVKQEKIDMLAHTWDEGEVTQTPTADKEGVVTYTCTVCHSTETQTGFAVSEKHVCSHTTYGIETDYGAWTTCDECGLKSYAVTALSAYTGSGAKHTSVDAYVPQEGKDALSAANMTKTGITVSDVAVSFNVGSGADRSNGYIAFTYTITTDAAMTVNVLVNGRSTNTVNNVNQEVLIAKFMELYQGEAKVDVVSDASFPAYVEGCPYWTEQSVAIINLTAGENTVTFRFNNNEMFNAQKAYGAYISYFRFLEVNDNVLGCDKNYHKLSLVGEKAATCTETGMRAHYVCSECGKVFDLTSRIAVDEKYLVLPLVDHVYENVTRKQADGTYAYVCTRGCGEVKEHVCTGEGNYLIIAREPNKVWYEEGETFDPARMEVYLSATCAEGCGECTAIAGHLHGYDALTYTYQNGDAFKAGDTYITINYVKDDVSCSVKLPVTVTAVGCTITVDNADEGFSYSDNTPTGSQNVNPTRANDTARVGQSGYGGSYANNFANGDTATFTFTLDAAKENARIVLRACTDRNNADSSPDHVDAVAVNDMIVIKVDGKVVELSDDVLLNGSVSNVDAAGNRWVWTHWSSIDLGGFDLDAGEHTVEILFNNTLDAALCGSSKAAVQLDCLNVFFD